MDEVTINVALDKEKEARSDFKKFRWQCTKIEEKYDHSDFIADEFDNIYKPSMHSKYLKMEFRRKQNYKDYADLVNREKEYFIQKRIYVKNYISFIPRLWLLSLFGAFLITGLYNVFSVKSYKYGLLMCLLSFSLVIMRFIYFLVHRKKAKVALEIMKNKEIGNSTK